MGMEFVDSPILKSENITNYKEIKKNEIKGIYPALIVEKNF